ncbi:MAG: homoserine O-acetyltransferase [Gammaproteobacteria bacterium]
MTAARRHFIAAGDFPMRLGGHLVSPTIAYETWGQLDQDRSNAILIFTGLSPSAHAASSLDDPTPGWWEEIIGPGKPIDTRRFFVICINSLGSCFGSTGPASIDPKTGELYRLSFPVLSLEDVARAGHETLRYLGIERLQATVGPSMGGMTSLAFEMLFPGLADSMVLMSTGTRSLPFSIALRSLQREMIRKDPAWRGGNYAKDAQPLLGMRLARKLGMITYRSAEEWRLRFGRERVGAEYTRGDPFGMNFEVESYLEHHAKKFVGQFDANCYLYLSRASDLFDLADHGATVAGALGKVKVKRALVIGVKTDFLFPIQQQQELADGLSGNGRTVEYHEFESLQGHDAFLVDMDRYRPTIAKFFA